MFQYSENSHIIFITQHQHTKLDGSTFAQT